MRKFEHRLFEAYDGNGCKSVSSEDDFTSIFEQAVYSKAKNLQYKAKAKAKKKAEKFKNTVLAEFKENLKDEKYIESHFTLYDDYIEFEDSLMFFDHETLDILIDSLQSQFKIFVINHAGVILYKHSDFDNFSVLKKVWLYFYNYVIKSFIWIVK